MRRYKYLWLISCLGLALTIGAFAFVSKSLKAADITLIDSNGAYYTTGYQTAIITTAGITVTIDRALNGLLGVQGNEPPVISPAVTNRTILKGATDTFQVTANSVHNANVASLRCFDYPSPEINGQTIPKFTTSQASSNAPIIGNFEFNTANVTLTNNTAKFFYVFEATDSNGLKGHGIANITVTTDATAPTVAITSPATNPYSTTNSSITLQGTAADNIGVDHVTYQLGAGAETAASGTTTWTAGPITLSAGSNVITVRAYDAVNNSGSASVTVNYSVSTDTTPPSVTITSPASNPYATTSSSITLQGTSYDAVGVSRVTYRVGGGAETAATGTTLWSAGPITLSAGGNVITVTAYDAANNAGTASITVNYSTGSGDTTPPTVTITSPNSNPYATTSSSITLQGTSYDAVGVSRVTYSLGGGAETAATGTTLWSAGPITLSAGSNVITVRAYDAANNAGTASVTVTYSTGGPVGNWYSVLTDPNSKKCDTLILDQAGGTIWVMEGDFSRIFTHLQSICR